MLWKKIIGCELRMENTIPQDLGLMSEHMQQYCELPMDFADASLVALASRLSISRIFTVDIRNFSIYRMSGNRGFTVIGP